jgi:hypothetical protein
LKEVAIVENFICCCFLALYFEKMEGEKPKIFLIGSSHAKRIGFQMSEIDQKDFFICNYGKSGLKVKDLKLPHVPYRCKRRFQK